MTDLPRSIPHVLLQGAQLFGAQPAIVDHGRRISYRDLATRMLDGAAGFLAAGLKRGERVALWAPNSLDWIAACLAIQAAGGILVTLNTRFKAGEVGYILNKSRARFLVTVDRFLGVDYPAMLRGLDLPHLERVLRLDSDEAAPGEWDGFLAGSDAAARLRAQDALEALSGAEISDIMFTSGTTGAPKGAMTTHAQNVRVYHTWGRCNDLRAGERHFVNWPFFHCSGYKSGWLAGFIAGETIYPEPVLDAARVLALIEAERINVLPGPPTLFQALLESPLRKTHDLSSLRVGNTGATTIPPALIAAMHAELGYEIVTTGYGLTETCGTATMTQWSDDPETVARTCGRAIPGCEIRCVDADNNPVAQGAAGEVVIRGFNVMAGYFEDSEATGVTLDADGWLHSGDIGVLDARGYLRITDRKKDMFITGGFNVYPAEIEKIMLGNTDYAQVAVIGTADARLGEVGRAYVVPRAGAIVVPEAVIAWCRTAMANYKVPREVRVVGELPLNAVGKVQKFRLREG